MNALVYTASIELIVSLALAWLAALTRYDTVPALKKLFKADAYLVKSHIDYLLMAMLLYIFVLLDTPLPTWCIACMILGSITNPFLLGLLAIWPKPDYRMTRPFGIAGTISFILTTAGFGGAAVFQILALST